MLIMLDNFEQVLSAAATLAELLAACSGVKLLVTSRECLHLLRWEQEYPLRPLQLPDLEHLPPPAALATVPSVALFLQRARARNPEFDFGPSSSAPIAGICVRLDGIPLAIELAAATTKFLAPVRILTELAERSEIPAQTGPDYPARHRSLREAISSSYALLSESEQQLFRRLSVFRGGFDHEALAPVCTGGVVTPDLVLSLLASLVDKSLVQLHPDGTRYSLLETIRGYALEALQVSGEADSVFSRHTDYFLKLGESAWGRRRRPMEYQWYERIAPDLDNFRATFSRALTGGDADTGLRLGSALSRFLWIYGSWSEAHDLIQAFTNLVGLEGEVERDRIALCELGWLTMQLGNYEAARSLLERCIEMARRAGDHRRAAIALVQLTNFYLDSAQIAPCLPILDEAVREARLSEYEPAIFDALSTRGGLAWLLDHSDDKAKAMVDEAKAMAQEASDIDGIRIGILCSGEIAFAAAEYETAATLWAQALQMFWSVHRWPSPAVLDSFARLAIVRNEPLVALRLAGAADAFRLSVPHRRGTRIVPWTGPAVPWGFYKQLDAIVGGDAKSHPEWVAGHAMSPEDAVDVALAMAPARTDPWGVRS